MIFENNQDREFEIINILKDKRNKTYYLIRFIETGYTTTSYGHNIRAGRVKDHFHPSIEGVGYLGNFLSIDNRKAYQIWRSILKRCYNPNSKNFNSYGNKGVKVSINWHCFEYFLIDLSKIEGYDKDKFERGDLHLDKDFKSPVNNKIYSLETCRFVTPKENSSIIDRSIEFLAISPEGVISKEKNAKEFAKVNNLTASNIINCLKGRYKQHKGWQFEYANQGGK